MPITVHTASTWGVKVTHITSHQAWFVSVLQNRLWLSEHAVWVILLAWRKVTIQIKRVITSEFRQLNQGLITQFDMTLSLTHTHTHTRTHIYIHTHTHIYIDRACVWTASLNTHYEDSYTDASRNDTCIFFKYRRHVSQRYLRFSETISSLDVQLFTDAFKQHIDPTFKGRPWRSDWCSPETSMSILPVVIYGCETWSLGHTEGGKQAEHIWE
jgi:hypothetical protein